MIQIALLQVLDWLQNCISVRLKAIYIVNNSYVFNILFNIFKPFIGSKVGLEHDFGGVDPISFMLCLFVSTFSVTAAQTSEFQFFFVTLRLGD